MKNLFLHTIIFTSVLCFFVFVFTSVKLTAENNDSDSKYKSSRGSRYDDNDDNRTAQRRGSRHDDDDDRSGSRYDNDDDDDRTIQGRKNSNIKNRSKKNKDNSMIAEQGVILSTLGLNKIDFNNTEEIKQQFTDVEEITKGKNTYYKANFNGVSALAKQFKGRGHWGAITGYIALSEDLTRVVGFTVTNHKEDYGAAISLGWFTQQFSNEKIVNGRVMVGKPGTGDKNKNNGSIDGISGATNTSNSVQDILDKEIALFKRDLKR